MTVSTIARTPVISDKTAATAAPAKPYQFKGKGGALRSVALQGIASLAYVEGKSRTDVITQLRIALGKSPSPADLAATSTEYVVGRVAQRLADSSKSISDQLAFARQLVTQYAAPVKDGVKAKALRKGQLGRRSVEQHKAVRAAEGAWYLVNAELGFGTSQTQGEKNKRSAAMKGSTARGKASAPAHGELVKSSATPPKNSDEAAAMIFQLASSLLAYTNKHAGKVDGPLGIATKRYHASVAEYMKTRKPADALK